MLIDILAARRRLLDDPRYIISRDQVMQWAVSEDLEALGALSCLLFDPDESRRIEPNLTLADYMAIELPYLARCLRAERFESWRNDGELRTAFAEAKLWREGLDELGMKPVDHRFDG